MTSATQLTTQTRNDVRTIVGAGTTLGLVTVVGVVVFALLSRALTGTPELIIQSVLIVFGGAVFAYYPSMMVRPRDVDSIAWAALVGLLGALVYTVIDTAVLRPLDLYHWTWDEIGGGSGFWYIPVWWMGSATLAWLGAWVFSIVGRSGPVNIVATAGTTVVLAVIIFAVLGLTVAPFHSAVMALAVSLALIFHIPLAGTLHKL